MNFISPKAPRVFYPSFTAFFLSLRFLSVVIVKFAKVYSRKHQTFSAIKSGVMKIKMDDMNLTNLAWAASV